MIGKVLKAILKLIFVTLILGLLIWLGKKIVELFKGRRGK